MWSRRVKLKTDEMLNFLSFNVTAVVISLSSNHMADFYSLKYMIQRFFSFGRLLRALASVFMISFFGSLGFHLVNVFSF